MNKKFCLFCFNLIRIALGAKVAFASRLLLGRFFFIQKKALKTVIKDGKDKKPRKRERESEKWRKRFPHLFLQKLFLVTF